MSKTSAAVNTAPASPTKIVKRSTPPAVSADSATASAAKRQRVSSSPVPKASKAKAVINRAPTGLLEIYVFGRGERGELGLGQDATDIRRPTLNYKLLPADIAVVQIACGTAHVHALTRNGSVLSWGVNDEGSLGRDTTWSEPAERLDAHFSELPALNPRASTPGLVQEFPEGTVITKLAAGDAISLALADDGRVYGWGTFRNPSGRLGFYPATDTQPAIQRQCIPRVYTELTRIVDIACGANHCLALSQTGTIYIWGCCEQNQLGRHVNERLDIQSKACLAPTTLRTGRKKFQAIFTGADHAFALDTAGNILAWGANAFGATGILDEEEESGSGGGTVFVPTLVPSLSSRKDDPVKNIIAGQNHSLAITKAGKLLSWGRVDGHQTGLAVAEDVPESKLIYDESGQPRIVTEPQPLLLPKADENVRVVWAAAGSDHSLALTSSGEAYTWGASTAYQTGQGSDIDVPHPQLIQSKALAGKKVVWAGAGAGYSILATAVEESVKTEV